MSAQAHTILVIDTTTNSIVKRVKHPDLVQPANGKFHPNGKRFYASGRGKVTVWDTTDQANPAYLATVVPLPGSTGEYRGVHVYKGSKTAMDGDVYWSNIQDGKVYVYRAADLEGAAPAPVKVFDTATDGIVGPHYFMTRPNTNEVWLTLRTAQASGKLIRINGDTRTIITSPTATLETTSTPGDEPTEFAFSKDGARAYVGHHGNTITGSPTDSSAFTIVDPVVHGGEDASDGARLRHARLRRLRLGPRADLLHDEVEPRGGGVRHRDRAHPSLHRSRRIRPRIRRLHDARQEDALRDLGPPPRRG